MRLPIVGCILFVVPCYVVCWCLYTVCMGRAGYNQDMRIEVCVCTYVFCMYCVYTCCGELK